jgi:uncharacterized protein YgbK (DUF1537 family)
VRSFPVLESTLLAGYPPEMDIPAGEVAASVAASGRTLVVLDDDPTGTQSVADLPVLTRWSVPDFEWAFAQHAPAVYVLTNTRSLDPGEAEKRNREVVRNALAAGGGPLGFVSRSDSTLRGHFPLEPEVIADELAQVAGVRTDAIVIVPAFPDAGRVTIGGTHYMRDGGTLVPVAETEFAQDAIEMMDACGVDRAICVGLSRGLSEECCLLRSTPSACPESSSSGRWLL